MNRCIIITAYINNPISEILKIQETDRIICADGGYEKALAEGIQPDLIIGDFDSGERPQGDVGKVVFVPVEKDDTDTLLCVKQGIAEGFQNFFIVGGMGGRVDHTIANLQTLAYGVECGCRMTMSDGDNIVSMLKPGTYLMQKQEGYKLSLLSFSDRCTGVSISGVHYPLDKAVITNSNCIGISNVIEEDEAVLSFESGMLMTMFCRD